MNGRSDLTCNFAGKLVFILLLVILGCIRCNNYVPSKHQCIISLMFINLVLFNSDDFICLKSKKNSVFRGLGKRCIICTVLDLKTRRQFRILRERKILFLNIDCHRAFFCVMHAFDIWFFNWNYFSICYKFLIFFFFLRLSLVYLKNNETFNQKSIPTQRWKEAFWI